MPYTIGADLILLVQKRVISSLNSSVALGESRALLPREN
jgi:hypothetical protein